MEMPVLPSLVENHFASLKHNRELDEIFFWGGGGGLLLLVVLKLETDLTDRKKSEGLI
jgi:hypothetical protein